MQTINSDQNNSYLFHDNPDTIILRNNTVIKTNSLRTRNNEDYSDSKDYVNRWVVSYADFITMLLALFMVLYAVSRLEHPEDIQHQMQKTFITKHVTKYQENNQPLDITKIQVDTHPLDITKIQTDKGSSDIERLINENLTQSNSVKLIKSDRGLIIRVNNKVIFDAGSASIKPDAEATLDGIVKVLTKIDNPVIIEGHTDSIPIKNIKYPSNWELSTARATNIISYIIKKGVISPKRLSAVGYGEYMPISNNSTVSGRMLNRRVDIIVLEKK